MLSVKTIFFILLMVFLFPLSTFSASKIDPAAKIEKQPDGLSLITLTPIAIKNLKIETAKVSAVPPASSMVLKPSAAMNQPNTNIPIQNQNFKTIPYNALLYDTDGSTWVYITPQPLVFKRHKITVHHIEDNTVYITEGPKVDTDVITIGVMELYGAEKGIGK